MIHSFLTYCHLLIIFFLFLLFTNSVAEHIVQQGWIPAENTRVRVLGSGTIAAYYDEHNNRTLVCITIFLYNDVFKIWRKIIAYIFF